MDKTKTYNWFNYADFYSYIAKKQFTKLAEIGVWKGHSISFLANEIRKTNPEAVELYAIDLFEDSQDSNFIHDSGIMNEVREITSIYNKVLEKTETRKMITDIKSISWEAADRFEDEYFDFVFIDADHSYESVKKDIIAWLPKIRKGGIISGHDYSNNHKGVMKAVNEIFGDKAKVYNNTVWEVNV